MAVAVNGGEKIVEFKQSNKKTLLLLFNTTCPACRENSPNWMDIWKEHDSSKVDVIAISLHKLERTKEYAEKMVLSYPVYVPKDSTLLQHYKLNAVPLTLLIGADGKVEKNWAGILTPAQMDELHGITGRR